MIVNGVLESQPKTLLQAPGGKKYAVINQTFTNIGSSPATFSLYLCHSGQTPPVYDSNGQVTDGDESTIVLKDYTLQPGETLLLNEEKFLLNSGDSIYANVSDSSQKVSYMLVFEEY